MKAHSRYRIARRILIFWCLFIGIGALGGATCMLIAPDGRLLGMRGMLPYFQVLPLANILYQNFLFPGIALLCVNGIPNLLAAALLFRRKQSGIVCGTVFGVTLMAWICIQFVIFPLNFMSTIYFIFGVAQAITGIAAWIFYQQEQFTIDEHSYPNIGTNQTHLVVFFSRMGYTKKVAFEEANRTGAVLFEIQAAEHTEGASGFWWCGRFGMHRWEMPIRNSDLDVRRFDHVTICAPIWVFRVAAPVRTFCHAASGKIRHADYILVHFQNAKYARAAQEMDALLKTTAECVTSICSRQGRRIRTQRIRG